MQVVKVAFSACAFFVTFMQGYSMEELRQNMRGAQEAFSEVSLELRKSEVAHQYVAQLYKNAVLRLSETIIAIVNQISANQLKQGEESYNKSDEESQALGLSCYGFLNYFWELSPEGNIGKVLASKIGREDASLCFKTHQESQEKLPEIE